MKTLEEKYLLFCNSGEKFETNTYKVKYCNNLEAWNEKNFPMIWWKKIKDKGKKKWDGKEHNVEPGINKQKFTKSERGYFFITRFQIPLFSFLPNPVKEKIQPKLA